MNYRAYSYINDKDYGYRVKSLFILLAKTTSELNTIPSKISDLRTIIYHLEKTKENIFDVQHKESKELSSGISNYLDYGIRSAESNIKDIDKQYSIIKNQRDFILYQLNEHGVPWHDQSFVIGVTSADPEFLAHKHGAANSPFVIDSIKVATKVYNLLSQHINPDKFNIKIINPQLEFSKNSETFCAVVTFSSAYSNKIRCAFREIVKEMPSDDSKIDSSDKSWNQPYDFFTLGHTGNLKRCLQDISVSPSNSIDFRNELVFLNLEKYQNSSDLLSEYIDMVSRNSEIIDPILSQQAESNCMEAYFEDHKSEVNLSRLMQALEREIEASQSFQQISIN